MHLLAISIRIIQLHLLFKYNNNKKMVASWLLPAGEAPIWQTVNIKEIARLISAQLESNFG